MIEILLLSFCLDHMQTESCRSAGSAYYKQSGSEQIIFDYSQKIQNRYKEYSNEFVVAGMLATFAATRSYSGRLTSIKGVDIITTVGEQNLLTFKKSY